MNSSMVSISDLPDSASLPRWLNEALTFPQTDGGSVYVNDRNRAFQWYFQKQLPVYDYRTEPELNIIRTYATQADEQCIWYEAWALFHQALMGCVVQEKPPDAAGMLWKLGRSQIGLEQYQAAELYLQAALKIFSIHPDKSGQLRCMMDHAVLTALTKDSSALDLEIKELVEFLAHSDAPYSLKDVALALFREGMKNDKWEIDGKPVPSCQRHAAGLYMVSLRLNRKVENRQAIACMLVNLGNIWVGLKELDKAEETWNELQPYLSEVAGDKNAQRLKQGVQKLQPKWWQSKNKTR